MMKRADIYVLYPFLLLCWFPNFSVRVKASQKSYNRVNHNLLFFYSFSHLENLVLRIKISHMIVRRRLRPRIKSLSWNGIHCFPVEFLR